MQMSESTKVNFLTQDSDLSAVRGRLLDIQYMIKEGLNLSFKS